MINIKKARSEHFDEIYILLKQLDNKKISKDDWKNIFIDHFNSNENYFGYILSDNNEIKGFLGLIFSKRFISNKEIIFANIGNWIVDKEYRNKSINLLFPILKLKNIVLTNFTASPIVSSILKTLNFKELGDIFYIIPPIPSLSKDIIKNDYNIFYDESVKNYLNINDQHIFRDHSNPDFNIKHILINNDEAYCYIIAKIAHRKKLRFLHIHYISNPKLFTQIINCFKITISFKFRVMAVIIDKRLLRGEQIKYAISYKLQSPRFYRLNGIDFINELEYMDHLYSEFMLLNI